MIKPIKKIKHIPATADGNIFADRLLTAISELQSAGYTVEIQYQSAIITDEVPAVVYSALIIGRTH